MNSNQNIEPEATQAPPRHTEAHPAEVTGDSARQGPRGSRVLYVLVAALVLCFVRFGLYLAVGAGYRS